MRPEEVAVNIVIRGLMAAGMGTYAAIHGWQALAPPDVAPMWLSVVFAAAAIVGVVLAVMLIATSVRAEGLWEEAAAILAGASLLALVAAFTVGFLGVQETNLRPEIAVVVVAEVVVLGAYTISQMLHHVVGRSLDEIERDRPTRR